MFSKVEVVFNNHFINHFSTLVMKLIKHHSIYMVHVGIAMSLKQYSVYAMHVHYRAYRRLSKD